MFVVVEGPGDAAIAMRLLRHVGHGLARPPIIKGGKHQLDQRLSGYNAAAAISPWFVLRDLDHDAPCAGALRTQLLPAQHPGMILRIAVRMAETWLLADRAGLARYLGVPIAQVPSEPEKLARP